MRTCTMLADLESVLRSLKSELGLRSVYHQTRSRADSHLFITVLACQVVQAIRWWIRERGETPSWVTLCRILTGQHCITAMLRRKDGRTLHLR